MSKHTSKNVFKSYLTWDNIIFAVILAAIIFYLFFQMVILNTSNPQVAVTTTSMVPTYQGFDLTQNYELKPTQYYDILRGDLLIVQNIKPHVGDVAVFKVPGEKTPIVHRLVAERFTANGTQEFATKGDHNGYTDAGDSRGNEFGWIPRSEILGVVVFAIHHLGWFSLQLQTPIIRVFLIVAVVAIILLTLFDNTKPKDEKEAGEKAVIESESKKRVFLKFKKFKIQVHRPTLFFIFLVALLTTTYVGIGVVNYSSGNNTVTWVYTNNNESKGILDLRSNVPEKYSNLYMYDYQIKISSSGFLNTVSKVEITPVYNNLTSTVTNPTYVWTIVYDYSGTKLIHSVMIFNVTNSMSNLAINTTINFKIYSSGLLASHVKSFSMDMTVLV